MEESRLNPKKEIVKLINEYSLQISSSIGEGD